MKTKSITNIILTGILLAILMPASSYSQGNGTYHLMTVSVDGTTREYRLYEPEGHTGTEEWPVVFLFHGLTMTMYSQVDVSRMYLVADTAKFFVIYPQGLWVTDLVGGKTGWGWNIPGVYSAPQDDVAFVSAMIDAMIANPDFAIDTDRIHATGHSNGGVMAYYLACSLSDKIASSAGVASQMAYVVMDSVCAPSRPVSVLHMLGTGDPFHPVNGDDWYPPLEGTAEYWAMQDNCGTIPFSVTLPDTDPTYGSTVTLLSYPFCYQGYEVLCYRIEGGAHAWPGGGQVGYPGVNNDIRASVEIWNFFSRNPHPNSYPFCLPEGIVFSSQQEIDGFHDNHPNCVEIDGDVKINGVDITDLSGLDVITSIGGNLSFYGNNSLVSLSGLENLTSIGGNLEIGKDLSPWGTAGNPSLTSLAGLNNLASIGGYLFIGDNDILTSLSGLDSIAPGSISNLIIYDNPALFHCQVQSICYYLLSPNGTVDIHDNSPGCNSQEEVEEACLVGVGESAVSGQQSAVRVFPNPTSGIVNCQFGIFNFQRVSLKIYDLYGREVATVVDEVMPAGEHILQFDMSGLPAGVYLYRLMSVGQLDNWTVGKLVKF